MSCCGKKTVRAACCAQCQQVLKSTWPEPEARDRGAGSDIFNGWPQAGVTGMGVKVEKGTALRLPTPDCTLATAAATGMPAAQATEATQAGRQL